MNDYIIIGPSPAGEPCAQVGDPNYHDQSKQECRRFKEQLIRQFGNPPTGAKLGIKAFHHDFGVYHEVVCYFIIDNEEAENYCYNLEANTPEYWEE
jgi:hypothetical protein